MLLRDRRHDTTYIISWLEHPTRCPHLSGCPTGPTVPANEQSVFHCDQITKISESVKKPRTKPTPPSRAVPGDHIKLGLFVLPSCIFPKHQLSWSCRRRAPPAVGSMPLQSSYTERIAGPLRALRDSGPSLRGARGFTPIVQYVQRAVAAAVSRHRFGANAGHCLRTRCFLRRPALHSGARGRGLMAGCRPRRPQTTAAWRARDRGSSGRGARRARDTDT